MTMEWWAQVETWIETYPLLSAFVALGLLLAAGEGIHRLVRHYILRFFRQLAERSPVDWDRVLFEHRVFQRLAWAVPLWIYYQGVPHVPHLPDAVGEVIRRVALACSVLVVARAGDGLLGALNQIYRERVERADERPIKGFLQVANVVAHLAAVILIVAILLDRSPVIFLSGLGAMSAVVLLVFRDTILSLVAGIQITRNDLLRVGDWLEMPQFDADGDVVDIALNNVRVQNWDRTITAIPTHKFLEHSFRNWRGMMESGGRRIMRAVHLDQASVRFLTDEEVEDFSRHELLRDYLQGKREELEAYNREHPGSDDVVPHHRQLTNLGTFRAYLAAYLRQHPRIRRDMTLMVRQLSPGPEGIPLQLYGFADDTRWPEYEKIQADIFDHVLAMVPRFGLRVFQQPTGGDVAEGLQGRPLASEPAAAHLAKGGYRAEDPEA